MAGIRDRLHGVVEWVMEAATIPVITKLTNVHSVVPTGQVGGESQKPTDYPLINTIQSVTGIDLDTGLFRIPMAAGKSVLAVIADRAVKPIALKMLTTIAQDEVTNKVPISGIGGVSTGRTPWSSCCSGQVMQVCTAAMNHGFRIVEDKDRRTEQLDG